MENQCRHNSFRQVSKIIPWSLQTPAALKEKQYKRFFKHKICKHSPGVRNTRAIGPEPVCMGLLCKPFRCSNLKAQLLTLNFEAQHKGSPYKAAGIAGGDRRTKRRIYCGLNGTSLSSLSIRLIRVYAIYWSLRWNKPPCAPNLHVGAGF